MLERKDSMAECYQRASERACVMFPLFGQGTTTFFFSYGYVTCQKNLGSVGRDYFFIFFIIDKTGNSRSGIRFRYLIFENSCKMTNYAVLLPSLLSISTKS